MASSDQLPKNYDFAEVEERWRSTWRDEDHYFDRNSKKPQFVIDTPPPYPTGNFHIGNALNWCYIDFFARYKRMKGFNVMFPQGWDCHGLPTEVKVEELNHITKNDVSREEFRKMCRELTEKNIAAMRITLRKMAFSTDWSNEYITMTPKYYSKTQLSFLRMLASGYIYQSEHPVNYCTRCETAIAFAEVAYEDRETQLNYFDFDGVEIATTRPELLAACVAVAVHPNDERYHKLKGTSMKVPLFGHDVPVVQDEAVDPAFGSGAVMICTFGDKQDVHWWKQHNLALRKAIDRQGKMTAIAGKYQGLNSTDCRAAILADMKEKKILHRQEKLAQRVGTCWRCKTPIEILSERQWFVKIKPDEIQKAAHEITWYPGHMLLRMGNWVEQMEWDWCISRQRIFATPIPVWFCRKCGEMVVPDEKDLPIDPTLVKPKHACKKCGSTEFDGEVDVLDTWMDSSISVLNVTGWDGSGKPPYFPAQIRPQGHDIIRTWAFYTILRAVALTGSRPWDQILVNGMVLGEDGFKMSKSRGNIIVPEEILEKNGADALRQWGAMGAATGSDIMFNWNDVVSASRFQTKMWNITKFALIQLEKGGFDKNTPVTALADRWLLVRLSDTVEQVSDAMEAYQFDVALKAIREFAWDALADNYIELVKGRLYQQDASRASACLVLHTAFDALCRMLAPFTPYFAEECYSYFNPGQSVHKQPWVSFTYDDEAARVEGNTLVLVVAEVRKYKHDNGMALNAPLGKVTIYAPHTVNDEGDTGRTLNADVHWRTDAAKLDRAITDIDFNRSVVGKTFRKEGQAFMDAVKALSPEQLANPPKTIQFGGTEVALPENVFTPKYSYMEEGAKVDVLTVGDVIVTIAKK
ncbi:MAG: valine--tRNA ligase [Methanoregula sp.]|uniref:valine--tRNA ligase n=1 Tax=Methanoregula sp. TaxID=2052170 RepID=UPI0025EB7A75|nr:valine--tRNA ligase [Methanoregula sp.]MCK9630243.1 valine--tRNA ligase [Methanoregula sp.]